MAINPVQFQPGLSMAGFIERYGTEAKCYRALYKTRWPHGFRCPTCGQRPRSRFRRGGRVYYQCRSCRHQSTLISGTLMAGTKLPLTRWFLALYLLTATKTNLSALELMRHLGVNYKAAWRIKHKVMQAMQERESTRRLDGFVQIDDAYLGGERNGGDRGERCALGQYRTGQPQAHDQLTLPCDQTGQVRAALPGRGRLPLQPPVSLGRDAAATGAGDDAVRPLPGAAIALGKQFLGLRMRANQVTFLHIKWLNT